MPGPLTEQDENPEISWITIIPTHRPKHLERCLASIVSQRTKPSRVIIIKDASIRDSYQTHFDDIIKEFIQRWKWSDYDNYSPPHITIINSHLSGALNAFKQCYHQMEVFTNITPNQKTFFHILEDDTWYMDYTVIRDAKKELAQTNATFQYLRVVDKYSGTQKYSDKVINVFGDPKDLPLQFPEDRILDTCGMVISISTHEELQRLSTFNKIIKDLGFCLYADEFAYSWFRSQAQIAITSDVQRVVSLIHPEQVSATGFVLQDHQLLWEDAFKGIKPSGIKHETYINLIHHLKLVFNVTGLRADTYPFAKPFKITQSIRKQIRFYKRILLLPSEEFKRELYMAMMEASNTDIMRYIIDFDLDNYSIDINPHLKENLK